MTVLLVVTTVGTRAQAQALAQALVHARLAACAQISAIESVYRWQGKVQQDGEFRVVFKTTPARHAELQAALLAQHPYTLPAIHTIATADAHAPYATWVAECCSGAD